jgi:uncharacterized protein YndB with AHSA1/START domain
MENFNWTAFTKRIAIKAPMKQLYEAWATVSGIERWFLSNAEFTGADGHPIPRTSLITAGSHYSWRWFLYDMTESGKITEANGTDFLQFTFAGECLVDVQLKQVDEYVLVELTQHNIPTDDRSKREIRIGCATGWAFYLVNLKSVYEGGLDLRNKDERFMPPMVNN